MRGKAAPDNAPAALLWARDPNDGKFKEFARVCETAGCPYGLTVSSAAWGGRAICVFCKAGAVCSQFGGGDG